MWAAGVDGWLDVVVATAQTCGSTAASLAHGAPLTATVCVETTPWEASAAVYAVLGEDITVEWETLPWEAKRLAYGITSGVCELLCVSTGAQRALAKAKWERRGRSLACSWCIAPAPWNAEDIGWRWVKLELFGTWANNAWACPGCAPWAPLADPDAKTFQRGRTQVPAPDSK